MKGGESVENVVKEPNQTQHEKIQVLGSVSFSDFKQASNPSFHMAKLKIMAINEVANKYIFTEESVASALPTIKNVPLVTYFDEKVGNLGNHDVCMKNATTHGIGTIGESCQQWLEEVDGSLYLCSDVILWKRQKKEFEFIKKHKELSVSMEAQPTVAFRNKEGIIKVEDFYFTAITILGIGISPAFSDSSIVFSRDEEMYQQMLQEVKEFESEGFSNMEDNMNTQSQQDNQDNVVKDDSQQEPNNTQANNDEEGSIQKPTPQNDGEGASTIHEDKIKQMEVEYGKTIRELTQDRDGLKAELEQIKQEIQDLRDFKKNAEVEKRKKEQEDVLNRYADLKDYEGYEDLVSKSHEYSAEELENQLIILYGRAERKKLDTKRPKNTLNKVNITTNTSDSQGGSKYFDRYGIK